MSVSSWRKKLIRFWGGSEMCSEPVGSVSPTWISCYLLLPIDLSPPAPSTFCDQSRAVPLNVLLVAEVGVGRAWNLQTKQTTWLFCGSGLTWPWVAGAREVVISRSLYMWPSCTCSLGQDSACSLVGRRSVAGCFGLFSRNVHIIQIHNSMTTHTVAYVARQFPFHCRPAWPVAVAQ
jgi:hypothetical protein